MSQPARLDASYRIVGPLPAAREELPLLIRVAVRNTGTATWSSCDAIPINLSYHWLDRGWQPVEFDGVRALLPDAVPPGAEAEVELWVEPPQEPGDYLLAIDLVEEGQGWFSQQGVDWLVTPVLVAPRPKAPRACIVAPLCAINDAIGNQIVNQLHILQQRGYEPLIFVAHIDQRQPAELRRYMVVIEYADLRRKKATQLTRRGQRFFRAADLYIFNYPLPYTLFDAIALVERGVVIVDYHGMTPLHLWDGQNRQFFSEKAREQRELFRYADYVIAHSDFTRQEVIALGALDPRRVHQMGYPVPLERFRPGARSASLLQRYGLEDGQPVLLYVGRLATNKRVEDLVLALALVRRSLPGAILLIVGDDTSELYSPVAARVRSLAGELGVSDAVVFTGLVPDDELAAHYQLADVFVTASLHEGFCIPAIEAMASGVPVVGAHATALPSTIGPAGLTFQPEDPADLARKLLELLSGRYHMTEIIDVDHL